MKYKIHVEVTSNVDKPTARTRSFIREVNLNYTDETWQECERIIRDTIKDLANDYINKEFY